MKTSFQAEPKLKEINKSRGPPVFAILIELIGAYNKAELIEEQSVDINLEKFIVDEILFFATMINTYLPTPGTNLPSQHPVAVQVKEESCRQVNYSFSPLC